MKSEAKTKKSFTVDDIELLRRLTGTTGLSLTHSELRVVAYLVAESHSNEGGFLAAVKKTLLLE